MAAGGQDMDFGAPQELAFADLFHLSVGRWAAIAGDQDPLDGSKGAARMSAEGSICGSPGRTIATVCGRSGRSARAAQQMISEGAIQISDADIAPTQYVHPSWNEGSVASYVTASISPVCQGALCAVRKCLCETFGGFHVMAR